MKWAFLLEVASREISCVSYLIFSSQKKKKNPTVFPFWRHFLTKLGIAFAISWGGILFSLAWNFSDDVLVKGKYEVLLLSVNSPISSFMGGFPHSSKDLRMGPSTVRAKWELPESPCSKGATRAYVWLCMEGGWGNDRGQSPCPHSSLQLLLAHHLC